MGIIGRKTGDETTKKTNKAKSALVIHQNCSRGAGRDGKEWEGRERERGGHKRKRRETFVMVRVSRSAERGRTGDTNAPAHARRRLGEWGRGGEGGVGC